MTDALTSREREVLSLVAAGNTAKEIARELAIMPRTVESHIDHIRQKLQVRNRAHMVARYHAIAAGGGNRKAA